MSLMLSAMLHVSVQRNLIGHYFAKIFKKNLCSVWNFFNFMFSTYMNMLVR